MLLYKMHGYYTELISDSSYSLLASIRKVVNEFFLKYLIENPSKRNLSHTTIKDVPSDVRFDDARHYQETFHGY